MSSSSQLRLGLLGVLFCAGCPGTLDDPSRFATQAASVPDAGCPDIPTAVFAAQCGTSGCHSTTDKVQGLDLQSPAVAARLVGACATEGSGLLVDPSSPGQSILYQKLSPDPPYGARMPSGKPALDDATRACVLTWISVQQGGAGSCDAGASDAGALADAPVPDAALGDGELPDVSPSDAGTSETGG